MMTADRSARRPDVLILASAFALVLALQIYLVFVKSINWDEFFHFQHVYQLRSGTLSRTLQIFYIHFFSWLGDLPFDPIRQLQVGRLAILFCEPVIALAIYGLVRRFAGSPIAAAFCALAYVTGGYVFTQIFAFRPDAQAAALLMSALWLFTRPRLDTLTIIAIAMLVALSSMLTIKSGLYAPAFLGLFYWRLKHSDDPARLCRQCALIILFFALAFAGLYHLHSLSLTPDPLAGGSRELRSAGITVFSAGLFPQAPFLIQQILHAPALCVMLVATPFLWTRRLASRSERVALAGLLLPVATVIFYRNSYPYNFVFILAPACVTIFPLVEWLLNRWGALLLSLVLLSNAIILTCIEPRHVLDNQRAVAAAVHRLFPQPVTYVDFCGFIGDFPRVYPFLVSGWGLARYRADDRPLLVRTLASRTVPLVLGNNRVISAALGNRSSGEMLPAEDIAALRENFVHHWGLIWVAGKRIEAGTTARHVTMMVPGQYTVEGAGIGIDNRRFEVGDTVTLSRGRHDILPDPGRSTILRWGYHLPIPRESPPTGGLSTIY
jgi:hypothetical protein